MTSYSDTNAQTSRRLANGGPGVTQKAETSFIDEEIVQDSHHSFGSSTTISNELMESGVRMPMNCNAPLLASDTLPSVRRVKAKNQLLQSSRGSPSEPVHSYGPFGEQTPLLTSTKADKRETFKEIRQDYHEDEPSETQMKRSRSRFLGKIKRRCDFVLIKKVLSHIKVAVLTLILVASVAMFAINPEDDEEGQVLAITNDKVETIHYGVDTNHQTGHITLSVKGPFDGNSQPAVCTEHSEVCKQVNNFVVCGRYNSSDNEIKCGTESDRTLCCWAVALAKDCCTDVAAMKDEITKIEFSFIFNPKTKVQFTFSTNHTDIVPFIIDVSGSNLSNGAQVALAAIILGIVYVLIVFEWVHRAMAAIIGSTAALAVLSMLDQRPTLTDVLELIEWNTIWLLFGMMVLVAIFSQTGFFDWAAVKMYKLARGKEWPLIFMMCAFAGIVSAFLDNVTTILLLTPVSIRLSQVLNLDPRYVLIAEVIFSNIGGTATAIGDPPNVIIVSSKYIREQNIGFNEFTVHMFVGIAFVFVFSFFFLRLVFCACCVKINIPEPQEVAELRRELAIWQRTANRMPVVSLEERAVREALLSKASDVENQLQEQFSLYALPTQEVWKSRLSDLEAKYTITDKDLLIRSSLVLTAVIVLFFVSNAVTEIHFELGWVAIFGAVVLLMLADIHEIERILEKVEWGTLVFFAALFVLMELLTHLGLIDFIAKLTVDVIENVRPTDQMTVAMLLILWVSALASAFIDNIPFTTAIIPVIVDVAEDSALCVELRPLVWALAFGACLGGNGTLIGASANVVCAGIAEQNGYPISFKTFFRIGFPMMIITVVIAMIYLLFCHSVIGIDINQVTMAACVDRQNNATSTNLTAFF